MMTLRCTRRLMDYLDTGFVSLDESELVGPRQADGDLPAIRFMHPAPGSLLIDKGVDVGLPFRSAAPDLGAFAQ
jgi:pectate lyase